MKKLGYIAVVLAALLSFSCVFVGKNPEISKISRATTGSSVFAGDIELSEDIISKKSPDEVKVTSYLLDINGNPVQSTSQTYSISADAETVCHNFKTFGKFDVLLSYLKGGKEVGNEYKSVVFTAEEYNVAWLIATLPVTYFSLMMADEDATQYVNTSLPTVMTVGRGAGIDFEKLYPNEFVCPFLDCSYNGVTGYNSKKSDAIIGYVGYLHSLNPESKFNFITTDIWPTGILECIFNNHIPSEKCTVTLLSDGGGSYSAITRYYGTTENAASPSLALYEKLDRVWQSAKNEGLSGKSTWLDKLLDECEDRKTYHIQKFIPNFINDEVIPFKWICARFRQNEAFGSTDAYNQKVFPLVGTKAFNIMLGNLYNNLNDTEKQNFLAQMHFIPEDYGFDKAAELGKGICIFLGTTGGEDEPAYVEFATKFMDKFVCYYKGHPGQPIPADSTLNAVNKFGAEIVDATVSAELFYFLKNDIRYVGYKSSTTQVLQNDPSQCVPLLINLGTPSASDSDYAKMAQCTIVSDGNGGFTLKAWKYDAGTNSYVQLTDASGNKREATWHPGEPAPWTYSEYVGWL